MAHQMGRELVRNLLLQKKGTGDNQHGEDAGQNNPDLGPTLHVGSPTLPADTCRQSRHVISPV